MPDSRQSAFAELKTRAFAHLSAQHPTASRKHRRAAARLAARGLVAEFRAVAGDADLGNPYERAQLTAAEAAALEASRPRPA